MSVSDDRWTCPACNHTVRFDFGRPAQRRLVVAQLRDNHKCRKPSRR